MAVLAAAVTCGALITVTQVSDAATFRFGSNRPRPSCPPTAPGGTTTGPSSSAQANQPQVSVQNGRQVRQWRDDAGIRETRFRRRGDRCVPTAQPTPTTTRSSSGSPSSPGAPSSPASSAPPTLEIGARDCSETRLQNHDGFQAENRCVGTDMGEIGTVANAPTAIIVDAPEEVAVNTPFTVTISTRNLERNRFLAAAAGGYYLEMNAINPQTGLAVGHAHFGCVPLPNANEAPPSVRSVTFVAVEDGGGSGTPDRLTINLGGIATPGPVICRLWAGGNSHALPLGAFANLPPAFDAVRMNVRA